MGVSSADHVFWKLHEKAEFQHILDEELGNEWVKERFGVVDWIDADLGEVIRHKDVVVYVYHGRANPYYEATW